jgi:hypothetical protein
LLLSRQVLVPEKDDPSLADQQGQFVKLLARQLRKLDIFQDSANGLGQINRIGNREKTFLFWIGEEGSIGGWGQWFTRGLWRDMVLDPVGEMCLRASISVMGAGVAIIQQIK